MTAPLRLVQVGAGSMGREWLRVVAESADAELVGLVDLDVELARRAADGAGVERVDVGASLTEVLGRVDAEAVLNVTVPVAHAPVSIDALLAGLPVLCEKPLADTVTSGVRMAAAAELTGRLLMVSQSRRYFRTLDAFRAQIAVIGPVGLVECDFFRAPHFGGFRDEMPYPLLVDMAIHQFDLARDLVGCEPVAVHCTSHNPSWSWYAGDAAAQATFEFAGGCRFGFSGSWCSAGLETSWNGSWRVSGAGGTALWDGDDAPVAETADGSRLDVELGEGPEQIAGSLAEFVAAVRTGTVPSGEARRNLMSLAMVEAAIRSAEQSRRVSIAEILDDAYAEAIRVETDPALRSVLAGWGSAVHLTSTAPG